jgi:hypothetical protein
MKFTQTIKNIFKIEDLRARILYTLLIVALYRLGKYVTLPGVDPSLLEGLRNQTSSGIMGLLDMFSGGAFSKASIFALGIMPYISASIVIQLPYSADPCPAGTYIPCQHACGASSAGICSAGNILYHFIGDHPDCRHHLRYVAWRKNHR